MPELPEVESALRRFAAHAIGRRIARVECHHRSHRRQLPPAARRSLVGRTITKVSRLGKLQIISLDNDSALHVHFRMTGDWEFSRNDLPPYTRVSIALDDGNTLCLTDPRALSTIRLVTAADAPPDLGPDANHPSLSAAAFHARLAARRAPIKNVLLDQRVVAGVGNIYAAESLWRARIDPRAPANSLDRRTSSRLLTALRHVLDAATGGRYSNGAAGRFAVYDREGKPCRRCKHPIERIVQAGRSTYFCPRCQLGIDS